MSGISGASADVSTDGRVRQLQAQIKDWTNCPTTDAQTKKRIVGKLENQLDGVVSAIKHHDEVKKEMGGTPARGGLDVFA